MIGASIFVVEGFVRRQIESEIVAGVRADLFERLALISRDAEGQGRFAASGPWDHWADDFGDRSHLRVSVIAPDGVVIGDSEVAADALSGLENHRDRPEVAAALGGEHGFSIRWSETLRRRMVYAAIPLRTGPRPVLEIAV